MWNNIIFCTLNYLLFPTYLLRSQVHSWVEVKTVLGNFLTWTLSTLNTRQIVPKQFVVFLVKRFLETVDYILTRRNPCHDPVFDTLSSLWKSRADALKLMTLHFLMTSNIARLRISIFTLVALVWLLVCIFTLSSLWRSRRSFKAGDAALSDDFQHETENSSTVSIGISGAGSRGLDIITKQRQVKRFR